VTNYEVFVDGSNSPMALVLTNQWIMTAANGLTTNSTHSFQISYATLAGVSPASPAAYGTTWGGQSWGGIPFEWMTANYGPLSVTFVNGIPTYNWPVPNSAIAPGGPTLYQAFLEGATADPSTWLKQTLTQTPQGMFLTWNTIQGATYQVQSSSNAVTWTNDGVPRFEAGTSDSLYVSGGGSSSGFYRVVLLRQ